MLKSMQKLIDEENRTLAPYAMRSELSEGRVHPEADDMYRLPFQRDRDRIIHCRAFRRLQAKTQVFVSYYGDHYRDRLTHSIEVAQIARDVSRTLGLNEDLAECLALAHDLGHPPFGHGGEDALNEMMQQYGLHFEHNEQSRRIIEELEMIYQGYDGLNVTKEVLDGLLKHNPHNYHTYLKFEISPHLEAQVTDISDEIAYTNHDVDDGLRAGIIEVEQLREFSLWSEAEKMVVEEFGKEMEKRRFLSRVISRMIRRMVHDMQEQTGRNVEQLKIDTVQKVRECKKKIVTFSDNLAPELAQLRGFLMQNFYNHEKVARQIERGKTIIRALFQFYRGNPSKMPAQYQQKIEGGEPVEVVVKDYVSGMTDHYAEEKYKEHSL